MEKSVHELVRSIDPSVSILIELLPAIITIILKTEDDNLYPRSLPRSVATQEKRVLKIRFVGTIH